MLTVPGHHLGDSWYAVDGARVHCYFLICPETVARHTAWDIAHASSADLRTWTVHGTVLRRGAAGAWDGECLATGSILQRDGRYWMAYTGNWCGPDPAVGLAVSDDLHAWDKCAGNPVTAIDECHYTAASRGRRRFPHWRDPFLLQVGDVVYQFVCAAAAGGDGPAGTIGVACSRDLATWTICPPLQVDAFTEELECPQVLAADGRYVLLFSTPNELILDGGPASRSPGGNTYCMVGDSPLGPYRMRDPRPVLPADMPERPYAGRIVWLGDRPFLLGTIWSAGGDSISDPIPVELTGGGLRAR